VYLARPRTTDGCGRFETQVEKLEQIGFWGGDWPTSCCDITRTHTHVRCTTFDARTQANAPSPRLGLPSCECWASAAACISARTRQPLRFPRVSPQPCQPGNRSLVCMMEDRRGCATADWPLARKRSRGSRVVIQWQFFHRDLEGEVVSSLV
jgi:hypothetical protein